MGFRKELGKIESAEFGKIHDMPFIFGLKLDFRFSNCCGVTDSISINIEHVNAKESCFGMCERVYKTLNEAKKLDVSGLVGVPVELEFDGNLLKSWRILTEVL